MTQAERDRLVALKKAKKKLITQKQAAEELGITERHVRRLLRALKRRGDKALVHALRGLPSNRKVDVETEPEAVAILRRPVYRGFGPTLASEYLAKKHGIEVSREAVRQWMIGAQLWRARKQHVEMWDQKESRAIDMVKWDASAGDWHATGLLAKPPEQKVRPFSSDLIARFKDRQCWAGVDLSMTTDLSAVSLVFPGDDGSYDVLVFFWMPAEAVRHRERRDGMPYQRWAEQGFIELCSGDVIDYRDITARLEWAAEMFDLEEIGFDPW